MTHQHGVYETQYGTPAVVLRGGASTAYDLDNAERIPIWLVTDIRLRDATQFEETLAEECSSQAVFDV